ncbi:MAG: hypothetical protein AB1547_05835 [Thermodesulfobacteriota bacterium]
MKLVNLTPHDINIADETGKFFRTIPPTGVPARVQTIALPRGDIDGVPFVETSYGEVENLPPEDEETVYIVSQFVINALPNRKDLVRPDTGPSCVRDGDGNIIGVRSLTR